MAEFISHSDEALRAVTDAIDAALEAMALQAVSHAKVNITVADRADTGNMRNSISHVVQDGAAYVGTNVSYAIYNELGTGVYITGGRRSPWAYQDDKGRWHRTRGMRPIHFLKNAVQDHIDEYRRIAESVISSNRP